MEPGMGIRRSSSGWVPLATLLVGGVALLLFTLLMRPAPSDVGLMALFLCATSILSIGMGYAAYRLGWITRSPRLRLSFISGYLLASLLTFLNVWITARLMFTSQHDLQLATVLLVFAGGIALILGVFYSQGLVERIANLNRAARQIAEGRFTVRVMENGRDELGDLALSFNQMAAELETTERKKQELDMLRKELVAWAGHDLRTPLASLRAIVEALSDGLVDDPATVQRYLGTAKKDLRVLTELIEDQFQMAQLDAGGFQLDLSEGSLSDLISDTIESFSEQAKRLDVTLEGSVEPGIDPVSIDVQRIGRVIINLVDNALRYTPAGGSVTLSALRAKGGIRVEVRNTGAQIAAEDLPHLFERFYRGDKSRTRSSGGAGLGLAIAKGIVEAHAGQIGAASDGTVTRFYFTIPARKEGSKAS